MGLTCSAVILTTITLRNVGDMKMRRAHLTLRPTHQFFASGHRFWWCIYVIIQFILLPLFPRAGLDASASAQAS
jgi:hypothetical protein